MKISVIMPAYNAAATLAHSTGSVIDAARALQDVQVELICVDDGSTDRTGERLDELEGALHNAAVGFPANFRCIVIHKANGGEGSARNAGLDVATGDLVAFLDADDRFFPCALKTLADVYRKTGADVIRYGWKAISSVDEKLESPGENYETVDVDFRSREESSVRFCQLGVATAVSGRLAGSVRFNSLKQGADMVWLLECCRQAVRTVYVKRTLLGYYVNPNSVSRTVSPGLVCGTLQYLPLIVSGCRRLGESDRAAADTREFALGMMFCRLYGAWRLFNEKTVRRQIESEYWRTLSALLDIEGFFPRKVGRLVEKSIRRRSRLRLFLTVILPYRLRTSARSE